MGNGENVGQINLGLSINQKQFDSQLKNLSKSAESKVNNIFSGLGKKIGAAFAIGAVTKFTKSCLDLGSNLAEVQNVVDVTFGNMSGEIDKFANNAMEQFGLSETVAKKMTGTFGAMSKAFGFNTKQAIDMSETLTGLSADVASFYNLSTDEAYTKIKSVFTGETESLKELGVVMTKTALDQYALNNGFGKTTAKMTEQEKVMLRYQFVQSRLAAASGDFARTSDGWANQVRVLSLRFDSLKATLGQGFINLFTPIIKFLNTLLSGLSKVADGFVKFTEMITGKKVENAVTNFGSIETAGAGLGDAADGADDLSSALDNTGKSAKKAAKAALGLSGFDKLNNVTDTKDSGSGSGAGGGTGASDIGSGLMDNIADASEKSSIKINSYMQSIIDKAKELVELFKGGFKLGEGDLESGFKSIKDNITSIGTSLKGIFTDKEVLSAADHYLDTMAESLGKSAGSFASIGVTIADFITGSISKYLSQNSERIKQDIIDMLNIKARTAEIMSNFHVAIADIFTVFRSDDAKQIGADLIAIFTTIPSQIAKLFGNIGNDILDIITYPIINNKDKVKEALSNTLGPISDIIGSIKDTVFGVFDTVKAKYEEYIKPAVENFKNGLSDLVGTILDNYNKHIAPVLEYIADKVDNLMKKYISPMIDDIIDLAGVIVKEVSNIWKKTLEPLLSWLIDKLAPIIAQIIKNIVNKFESVAKTVSKVVKDVVETLKGIVEFISGIFTGDIDKAFKGLKDIVNGCCKGIKDVFLGMCDYIKVKFENAINLIKVAFKPVISFFKDILKGIENVFSSIDSWFKQQFVKAANAMINAFSGVKKFFKELWSAIKEVFSLVGSWFKTKFDAAYTNMKNAFTGCAKFFSSLWEGIKGAFSHVSTWFQDTFSKAWEKVKDVFSTGGKIFDGIKDGIASTFKTVVNGLIGGINKIISIPFNNINGMLNKIHDVSVLGVKPFSGLWSRNPLSVPQIPKLATGGYVKANTPQLAMIGDNRHQGEVVAPEGKLQELLDKAVSSNNMSSLQMAELLAILRDILRVLGYISDKDNTVHIGDSELGQAVQRFARAYKKSTGKEAFN